MCCVRSHPCTLDDLMNTATTECLTIATGALISGFRARSDVWLIAVYLPLERFL